ncbi:MAG: Holliday junction branch migration protein RuvA [Gammaproteobacteria bacterium]|nr:Holliday junction branch migration protein RuvA [Gammaproteobacteria bacterium]MCP5425079.1 Holliday junction branch migration protein RuvA [Gammaproteobacteria bacterium]
MIGRLRGVLAVKQPPYLMIEVQGVGYDLEASLSTFQNLPEVGAEVSLHTHLAVREDTHALYGFATVAERTLFRNLIKISGIGAKLALLILSGMTVDAFARCIQEGDTVSLTRLPGIGKKTAERLLVEMRDRIGTLELGGIAVANVPDGTLTVAAANPRDDAISALVTLGYKLPDAVRMVGALDTTDLGSEEIIRQALQAAVRKSL